MTLSAPVNAASSTPTSAPATLPNSILPLFRDGITIITGCNTDVGKTVTVATLSALLSAEDVDHHVVKPVQTGVTVGEPGDLSEVRRLNPALPAEKSHEFARLPEPLAPTTAARRAQVTLPTVAQYAQEISTIANRTDAVLVEGAGGILVGLDPAGAGLLELATALASRDHTTKVRFLVVADPGLGTLNSTLLTCRAIRDAGNHVAGVVFGTWPRHPDLACQCNREEIADLVGAPLLFAIPSGVGCDRGQFLSFLRRIREPRP